MLEKAVKVADDYSLSHKGIFKYGSSGFLKSEGTEKGSAKVGKVSKLPLKGSKNKNVLHSKANYLLVLMLLTAVTLTLTLCPSYQNLT